MENRSEDRILIVDDQENWREALASLLSEEGYTVRTIGHFEEAAEEITRRPFDLVVLDLRLVDREVFNVQGLELLQLVKTREPESKVIVLTGYPESIRKGVLEEYGADALVLKVPPGSRFDSTGFREEVRKLLRKPETA